MVRQQFLSKNSRFLSRSMASIAFGLGLMVIAPGIALAESVGSDLNTYLYGTTPEAGQIGHEYMVMQHGEDESISGAFYYVDSEYACFSGEVGEDRLNLAIVDPYEQVAYEHQLDYDMDTSLVASADGQATSQIVPEGFHLIEIISDLATNILAKCSAETPVSI